MNKNDKSNKFTIQKATAEATFNILRYIQPQQMPFDIIAHTGVGMSFGDGYQLSDTDKMMTLQMGVMPLYHVTSNLSILLDAIYILNFQQNQGYDGLYVFDNVRNVIGSYLLLNIGLGVRFAF